MRIKKQVLLAFAVGFVAFAVTAPIASARSLSPAEASLLRAVNATRAAHGLHALRIDNHLEGAARSHSQDMLARNYFAHGDFAARMASFHASGAYLGENIAWGSGPYATAQAVVNMWLASPPHRANLLRPGYTRVGLGEAVGTFQGNTGAAVVTADFAGR